MSKLSLLEIAQSQLDKTPVIDGQLIVCLDTGNAYRDTATAHVKIGSDLEVVSDLPLAPLAEKIYYLKPDKLYAYLGGNWTLLNDKTIDLDKVIAKLPAGSSTALNDDVEIITQDTDTTQAHYYRRKLVVIWEYIKTKAQDFFAAKNHKHKKADITDFPTSMPASDVYPWAKAAKKPSYTKAEIGLGKVDNTADADKTVKRATTAGTADSANSVAWENVKDKPTTFPVEAHNHDDRYYTEAEVNSKLNNKVDNTEAGANGLINKLESGTAAPVDNDLIITQWANHTTATAANQNRYVRRPMSSIWSYIKSKADSVYQPKGSYTASGHTHDDRYYTESEIDSKLSGKANSNHSHYSITTVADNRNTNTTPNDYRNTFIFQGLKDNSKINSPSSDTYSYLLGLRGWNDSSGGNSHELAFNNTGVYWRNGSTEWNGWNRLYTENYHPNADHASSADYATNAGSANGVVPEWSGSVDLNSSSRLAAWSSDGKKIKAMSTGTFAKASHTHTKAQVGLSNVDNTADANKSVKYATSSGTADSATTSNGVKDYNDANRTIKIGFAGAGLTSENLTHIAGYTDNGTKIKDVSKDVLKSWIGLGNYLPLIGGTMSGQITKSTGGSWIGDRDRAAIKSSCACDGSYGAVAAMATKNGYWTMGNLGGNESLIFNYSTDAKYNAGKNETSQVYLPAQAGTIITSATIGSQSVNYANRAGNADVANSVDWSKVQNKPSSYAPASHTHDDRYYTESEVNTKLANYQPKGNYAAASHTHNYAGSGTAGGSANSAVKLDSSAGSATQPVYFKDGKPVATTYALNKTVPADAKFTDTNTWRGIQNNLTSDSTDQSLSAAQGKALKTLVDGKAPASHKHTKSQITDFPTSMPASDVSAWAKAATKPSYTKAEVGLGNVDNTADKDKSVKYATSAESATTGLNGVSTCIFDLSSNNGSCVRFYNGLQICFGNSSKSSGVVFKLPFANDNYAVVVGGSDTLKNAWYVAGGRTTTGFNPNQNGFAVLFHWIAIGNWK